MNLELLGFTLQTIGEILIAYTAIMVHFRFWKEHKIDENVFKVMKKEQVVGIFGVLFLLAGYIFHLISF